jgi:hypothetical protein
MNLHQVFGQFSKFAAVVEPQYDKELLNLY